MHGSGKSTINNTFDALLSYEIQKLNNHLPKERRALNQLLELTDPTVEAIDGSFILLKTTDLEELAKIVPPEYRDNLRLPLIILRRMEFGRSVYTVAGGRVEQFAVQKILGKTSDEFSEVYKHKEQMFLY